MPKKKEAAAPEETAAESGGSFFEALQAGAKARAADDEDFHSTLVTFDGQQPKLPYLSSGNEAVDSAIGIGGWPLGRFVLMSGGEGSGKTSLALQTICEAQKQGGFGIYLDGEHKLSLDYAFDGLGVDKKRFGYTQIDSIEESVHWIGNAADVAKKSNNDTPIVVVVDSVSSLSPQVELEGKDMPGMHALAWSKGLRKAVKRLGNNSRMLVMLISQDRTKIGVMYGDPDTTSGGKGPRFYSTVIMKMNPYKAIVKDGKKIGNHVKAIISKNQVAAPFRECELQLLFGKGFEYEASLYEALIQKEPEGLTIGKNKWIDFDLNGKTYRFQGDGGFRELVAENPTFLADVRTLVRGGL